MPFLPKIATCPKKGARRLFLQEQLPMVPFSKFLQVSKHNPKIFFPEVLKGRNCKAEFLFFENFE